MEKSQYGANFESRREKTMKKWMNTKEAMEYVGMGEKSLRKYMWKAMIQFAPYPDGYKKGTRRYWSVEKIDEIMKKALKNMG
jgi:hypothetical protein